MATPIKLDNDEIQRDLGEDFGKSIDINKIYNDVFIPNFRNEIDIDEYSTDDESDED